MLDQGPFDHVFQFPHVARPVIGDKPVDGARGQHRSLRELKLHGLAVDEVMHQGRDIFSSLPERRDHDGKDIEAEPEVFAKSPRGDHLLEISMRGRYNTDVHRYGTLFLPRARFLSFEGHAAA